jgi:hypothetical protein
MHAGFRNISSPRSQTDDTFPSNVPIFKKGAALCPPFTEGHVAMGDKNPKKKLKQPSKPGGASAAAASPAAAPAKAPAKPQGAKK